jgi:hypothetical protein
VQERGLAQVRVDQGGRDANLRGEGGGDLGHLGQGQQGSHVLRTVLQEDGQDVPAPGGQAGLYSGWLKAFYLNPRDRR